MKVWCSALIIPAGITLPLIPATVVLVILAVPPILAATSSGFRSIDRVTVDAAYAMGHSTGQVVRQVEFPLAMPVLIGGVRSAGWAVSCSMPWRCAITG